MTDDDLSPDTADESHQRPLRLTDVQVSAGDRILLRDTTVMIPGGKITVIVGGSGAGKSVLLRVLAGLLPHNGQAISWSGNIDLGESDSGNPVSTRKRVGIVFQQFALFDELSPTANVQFAIDHRSHRGAAPLQSAKQWLDELGVPHQHSGCRIKRGTEAAASDRAHFGGRSGDHFVRRADFGT